MSFNSNDNNPGINLGNYEEYFILYMDNELSAEQKALVDAFLLAHPDLQTEFDILLNTQLQPEDICLDKEALWAHSMKLNAVDEDLLLYIDKELPADRKKIVELELASNQAYLQQYQGLLQTKLDASETIAYPNKAALYHRTERVVAFKPWMRIAAAVVLIGAIGIFYFTNKTSLPDQPAIVVQGRPITQPGNSLQQHTTTPVEQPAPGTELPQGQVAVSVNPATKEDDRIRKTSGENEDKTEANHTLQEGLAYTSGTTEDAMDVPYPRVGQTTAIDNTASIEAQTASFDPSKEIINTSRVTSELTLRNTINDPGSSVPKEPVASNNKGSFKGFLRKATRVIGRRTGLDPTSNDGEELLIGAVALKLN